jgi:hypothetical protein
MRPESNEAIRGISTPAVPVSATLSGAKIRCSGTAKLASKRGAMQGVSGLGYFVGDLRRK